MRERGRNEVDEVRTRTKEKVEVNRLFFTESRLLVSTWRENQQISREFFHYFDLNS